MKLFGELVGIAFQSQGLQLVAQANSHYNNYKISKLNPTLRDTLFSLFQCKPRFVEYDGVSTYWDDTHKGVWCPSIDTILFAKKDISFIKIYFVLIINPQKYK